MRISASNATNITCIQYVIELQSDFLLVIIDAFIRLEFKIIVEFHIQVEQRPSTGLIGESNASQSPPSNQLKLCDEMSAGGGALLRNRLYPFSSSSFL